MTRTTKVLDISLSYSKTKSSGIILNAKGSCYVRQEAVTTACTRGFNIFAKFSFVAGKANFCSHLLASLVHFTVFKSQAILIIRLGVAEVICHSSWGRRSCFRRNFTFSASFKTTKFLPRWTCSGTTNLRVDCISIIALTATMCLYQ